jgi:hypothetical protein
MKTAVVVLAGAMFASGAYANASDAEARFQAKYGRSTPTEAGRQNAAKAANAKDSANWVEAGCCQHMRLSMSGVSGSTHAARDVNAEHRYRAKYGRSTPAEEQQLAGTGGACRSECFGPRF